MSTSNESAASGSSSSGPAERSQFLSSQEEQRFLFGRGRPAGNAVPNAGQMPPRSSITMRRLTDGTINGQRNPLQASLELWVINKALQDCLDIIVDTLRPTSTIKYAV